MCFFITFTKCAFYPCTRGKGGKRKLVDMGLKGFKIGCNCKVTECNKAPEEDTIPAETFRHLSKSSLRFEEKNN